MKEEAEKKARLANAGDTTDTTDSNSKPTSDDKVDATGDEETKEQEKNDKQVPLPGNGGFTDRYRWSQTLEEVTIHVPLPDGTEAKNLEVKMMSKKLVVAIKGQPTKIIDGELPKKIKVDDSLWSIEKDGGKRTLQLNLTKSN
jgi:hypothetical protein